MKLEERFAETLRKAVANRSPVKDARALFESKIKRARRIRFAVSLAGVTAMIVAAAVAVPLLSSSGPAITQSTQSPSTDSKAGWLVLDSAPEDRFRLKYPPNWAVTRFGGAYETKSYEVLPPGFRSKEAGGLTFAVSINVVDESLDPARPQGIASRIPKRADGRPYLRSETQTRDGPHEVIYRIAWSPPCAFQDPGCAIGQTTLIVHMFASDTQLWDQYSADGEGIVGSIEWA